jgi:serine/threonine-protein kinase
MLSQIVYDFEAAHQNGDTPRLQDFVPADAPDRTAVAAELVRIDLEYRGKRGLPISADQYLTPFPELASDKELLRELIEAESRARQSGDSSKTPGPHGRRLTESGDAAYASLGAPPARAPEALATVTDLLDALRQSQLLGPGRLEELAGDLPSPPPEAPALAGDLVRRGWLTPFQAEQLLHGRGRALVLGPYVLLERLGEGGMGTVYKARHRSMERVVALKVIRPERLAQGDTAQRFQREIRALAQLSHANIVTAYHADCAGDTSFLVMEYVAGTDLYRLVEASGPLAVHQACDFIRQAALALQHAYECGLVHRDVKPSNLLLMRDRPVIKLLDLGLARHEAACESATAPGELTREGVMLGTPDYMAPEQAVDPRRADIRADVYSLGCTLYYLLAARPPFPEGTLTQKLLWHQQAEPPRIEDVRPGLPAGLPAVLRKMMARRPEDRYQAPAEVAAALAPFVTPAPADARADSPPSSPPLAEGAASAPTLSHSETPPAPDAGKLLAQAGKLLTRLLKPDGGAAEAPAAQDEFRTVAGIEPAEQGSGPKRRTRREPGSRKTQVDNQQVAKLLVRVGRMLMQVGKMLAVVLILLLGAGVYYIVYSPSEPPERFLARVANLIDQEQFKEALEQILKADQEEHVKANVLRRMRNDAVPWAEKQLDNKQDPDKVREVLDLLQPQFPGDVRLAQLRGQAHELDVQQQVVALVEQKRYKDALSVLRQQAPDIAEAPWAREEKDQILQAWTDGAAALLKARQFKKSAELAQAILSVEKDYAFAEQVRAQADFQRKTITAEVTSQLNKKAFEGAYDQLVKDWPSDEDQLKDTILQQWLAAVEQYRKGNQLSQLKKADAALVAMAKRYDQDGHKVAINALKREVARDRVRLPVIVALKAKTWPPLQEAADALTSKGATNLDLAERKMLREQLERAWITLSKQEKDVQAQVARLRNLPLSLQSKATQVAIADIIGVQGAAAQINAALHLQELTKGAFAKSRADLQALQGKSLNAKDRKRIESLLVLLDRAQKGAEQPLSDAVEAFEASLSKSADLTPADRAALEKIPGRLFALRIRQSIPTPAQDAKWWAARLADCTKVKQGPDTWVLACRVECLAELKQRKQDIDAAEWERAWGDFREHLDKRQPAPGAEPYALYVRALALAASDMASDAATLLTKDFGKKDVPTELQVAHRKQRAAGVLLEAAENLRTQGKGPLREPFGPPGGADTAFPWLELAYRLAGPAAKDGLRQNLVLAAWYKQQPDRKLAGQVVPELLRKESLDKLNPSEAFLFALIHAKTRGSSPQGRTAALASYQTALDRISGLLRARVGPGAAKAFRENVVLPACEAYSIDVINPLCSKEGLAQLLPAEVGAELQAQVARLAAGSAELIRANLPVWEQLGKNPLEKEVTLYDRAYQLASAAEEKADYLVHKAYAYYGLPHPTLKERQEALQKLQEYAKTATTLAPQYAGGYALKGITLLYESRELLDIGKKLDLLRKADDELQVSLRLRDKLAKDKADQLSLLLYPTLGSVCMELGNYQPKSADKAKYLHRGKDYLEQLLKHDDRNRDAWDRYGLLLEYIGLYLGPAEEYYARACDALQKAMDPQNLGAGQTMPWLDRGRVQVRWAALGGKEAVKLMMAAAKDLEQVTNFGGESVEAAEAYFWQGKLAALQKNPQQAGQAFAQALKLARKAKSPVWEEAVLNEWCTLALAEASARLARRDHAGVTKYADVAEARARELEQFSKAAASLFLVNAYRVKTYAKMQPIDADNLLTILKRGLEGERLQDRIMQVHVLAERARVYMEGTEVKKDVSKAYADAVAALKLADQVSASDDAKALPLGIAGEACLNYKDAWKYYPEAVARLRQAITYGPAHAKAWWWKGLLAATLTNEKFKADGEHPASLLEEAARNIAEANQTSPASAEGARNWVKGLQKKIEEKALPALQKAVKENGQAADAWKWHWRIAEILAARGEPEAGALTQIRQAAERMPADAPAPYRARILALRKQLEKAP